MQRHRRGTRLRQDFCHARLKAGMKHVKSEAEDRKRGGNRLPASQKRNENHAGAHQDAANLHDAERIEPAHQPRN